MYLNRTRLMICGSCVNFTIGGLQSFSLFLNCLGNSRITTETRGVDMGMCASCVCCQVSCFVLFFQVALNFSHHHFTLTSTPHHTHSCHIKAGLWTYSKHYRSQRKILNDPQCSIKFTSANMLLRIDF